MLALTSPTSGGRSVGIVRSRTHATELLFYYGSTNSVIRDILVLCRHRPTKGTLTVGTSEVAKPRMSEALCHEGKGPRRLRVLHKRTGGTERLGRNSCFDAVAARTFQVSFQVLASRPYSVEEKVPVQRHGRADVQLLCGSARWTLVQASSSYTRNYHVEITISSQEPFTVHHNYMLHSLNAWEFLNIRVWQMKRWSPIVSTNFFRTLTCLTYSTCM
jgi:hypothetical protein